MVSVVVPVAPCDMPACMEEKLSYESDEDTHGLQGDARAAALYAAVGEMQREQGREFVVSAAPKGKTSMNILDFGCGTGPLVETLLGLAADGRVYCVDPDAERLAVAEKNHESAISAGKLVVAQADDASLADVLAARGFHGKFDMIVVNFVIHWVENKAPLYKMFSELLHPEGIVLVQSPANLVDLHRKVTEMTPDTEDKRKILGAMHFTNTLPETKAALHDTQLTVQNYCTAHVHTTFPTLEAYLSWWTATMHGIFDWVLIPDDAMAPLRAQYPAEVVITEAIFRTTLTQRPVTEN